MCLHPSTDSYCHVIIHLVKTPGGGTRGKGRAQGPCGGGGPAF